MIRLKKYFSTELIQLSILFSLLRLDPGSYLLQLAEQHGRSIPAAAEMGLGSGVLYAQPEFRTVHHSRYSDQGGFVYPKNVESDWPPYDVLEEELDDDLRHHQMALIRELNQLGRYNRFQPQHITTYLLCSQEPVPALVDDGEVDVGALPDDAGAVPDDAGAVPDHVGNETPEPTTEVEERPVTASDDGFIEGSPDASSSRMEVSDMFELPELLLSTEDDGFIDGSPDASGSRMEVAETSDVTDLLDSSLLSPGSSFDGDLTKEDMDLIEILLRQDIDLGVTRHLFDEQLQLQQRKDATQQQQQTVLPEEATDDGRTDDTLAGASSSGNGADRVLEDPQLLLPCKDERSDAEEASPGDPWSGLNYTIDSETGEHVVHDSDAGTVATPTTSALPESSSVVNIDDDDEEDSALIGSSLHSSDLLSLPEDLDTIPLEEFNFGLTDEVVPKEESLPKNESEVPSDDRSDSLNLFDFQNSFSDQLRNLEDMIQTAQLHPHPHAGRAFQTRMPYLRPVSMEQRWPDLTNMLTIPPASEAELHHHHHHLHHHNMSGHMGEPMLHHGGSPGGGAPLPHHHHHQQNYSLPGGYASIDNRTTVLLQNATLPPPVADVNNSMSYQGGDPSIIGSAVVTSMSAHGNDSLDHHGGGHYQMESGGLLYPGNHSDVNQTADGFFNTLLNDADLIMDMALTDGLYTMRMMENEDAMDTSSDSAVSSMASSERVPSLSYGEWMENGTAESPHNAEEQERFYAAGGVNAGADCTQASKYRQYNYSYAPGMAPLHRPVGQPSGAEGGVMDSRRLPPVAQKKYQLFGKRLPSAEPATSGSQYGSLPRGSASMPQPTAPLKYQDYSYPPPSEHHQSSGASYGGLEGATAPPNPTAEQKYSCRVEFSRQHHHHLEQVAPPAAGASLEHVQHNHTYLGSAENTGDQQRPAAARDKHRKKSGGSVDEHVSRDERRARSMKLPMTSEEIINLPMDEFNERLSKYDLTEAQLALIRDIRRRGKNKVAAQNCRKRKLDQILLLAEEVTGMQKERHVLLEEQQMVLAERQRIRDKYAQLYRHVFQSLRDPDGSPYSPFEYSLQQAADGNILLVPRNGSSNLEMDPCNKGAKSKRKDDDK